MAVADLSARLGRRCIGTGARRTGSGERGQRPLPPSPFHIHDHFEYRYVTVGNGSDAFALEREVQRGALSVGKRFLNPL